MLALCLQFNENEQFPVNRQEKGAAKPFPVTFVVMMAHSVQET